MNNNDDWSETYDGGSPEAEQVIFRALGTDMLRIQEANRQQMGLPHASRTLHAKMVAGIANASLVIDQALPADLSGSYFRAGAEVSVSIRFSNASGIPQPDGVPDMRGVAIKCQVPGGGVHDLLMTNYPTSHARNARQFVDFALLASGDKSTFPARLVEHFGQDEAQRMIANLSQGIRASGSLAAERFWSRGAVLWAGRPVRFQLRPDEGALATAEIHPAADALRDEFAERLANGPVRFRLALQRYVDEQLTPIEDGAVEWTEASSPPIEVATLVIPQQNILDAQGMARSGQVEDMVFNPWNAPDEFRPLGNLNRVRRIVYGMSAERWQDRR
jgi:catalase